MKIETGTREHKQYTFHGSSNLLHVTRNADGIELNWQSDSSLPHTVSNQERDEVYQQVLKSMNLMPSIKTNQAGENDRQRRENEHFVVCDHSNLRIE